MTLTDIQVQKLRQAIAGYDWPARIYDFDENKHLKFTSYKALERELRNNLLSPYFNEVRFGLANVLWWGMQSDRLSSDFLKTQLAIKYFTEKVMPTLHSLSDDSAKNSNNIAKDIVTLSNLGLPEFSRMAFVSKLMMFLNPTKYVVLDSNLSKLKDSETETVFRGIVIDETPNGTSIRITTKNSRIYGEWCNLCKNAAASYYPKTGIRAVDVERGIFQLVRHSNLNEAAEFVSQME